MSVCVCVCVCSHLNQSVKERGGLNTRQPNEWVRIRQPKTGSVKREKNNTSTEQLYQAQASKGRARKRDKLTAMYFDWQKREREGRKIDPQQIYTGHRERKRTLSLEREAGIYYCVCKRGLFYFYSPRQLLVKWRQVSPINSCLLNSCRGYFFPWKCLAHSPHYLLANWPVDLKDCSKLPECIHFTLAIDRQVICLKLFVKKASHCTLDTLKQFFTACTTAAAVSPAADAIIVMYSALTALSHQWEQLFGIN